MTLSLSPRVLGIDPGVGRLTWGQLNPGLPVPARYEGSGELKLATINRGMQIRLLLEQRMSRGLVRLLTVEGPDPPPEAGGRGRARLFQHNPRRRHDCDKALLELGDQIIAIGMRLGLLTLWPEVSQVRTWASQQPCPRCGGSGSIHDLLESSCCPLCAGMLVPEFNWHSPDGAIKAWFRARGASDHSLDAKGVLSNRDKRDAMLAACYGASKSPEVFK